MKGYTYTELFQLAINKPILAQIEITRNCNHGCFFCFRQCQPGFKYNDQPLGKWLLILDKLYSLGIRQLNLSGGEVFLYKDIDSLIKYAKRKKFERIVVNTNGLIKISPAISKLTDEIVFSIHGLGKDHDQITGVSGSFKNLFSNLASCLKIRKNVGINTVVSENNIGDLEAIYDHFKDYKLLYHSFNLYIDRENLESKMADYSDLFNQYFAFLKTIPQSRLKLRHGMHNVYIDDKNFYQSTIPLPNCAAGKYKMVIDYKGDIYPCRYFQEEKYLCGNVFSDELQDVWQNGKGFEFFRHFVLANKIPATCESCLKRKKCLGGCLAWRVFNDKLKIYEKDIRCQFGNAYLRG